ncbi:myxosortase MrtC [Polyangium sp. 6x1]|uniref:myxosortase MrtC n=1 Tax=Polyangium sp. 6x1 TaxID=3042689 RepID=UPI0024828BC3|nr:MrtC family glutamic-type intramembrane protease [Polyangium sp. 6x1]MDI1449266.1 MrtC family glutamic-type intramembrane protease [Polyangium sp. 6x1]
MLPDPPAPLESPEPPPAPGLGAESPAPAAPLASVPEAPSARRPLLAVLATTLLVTALSYLVPKDHAGTAVGLAFLAVTWWLVLRADEHVIRAHGLSLGGLLEPLPLDRRRLMRDAATASLWVLLLAAIIFPPFWFGFKLFWRVKMPFVFRGFESPWNEISGHFLAVALPEEAFFRGYLQTQLDAAWAPRWRVFGADLGPGVVVSSAIFAIGHFLTVPSPDRLAVFFPSLVFGWLRARTGGVGAGVVFHALCNIFSATLQRGYGFSR